jgi:hypothetical protein
VKTGNRDKILPTNFGDPYDLCDWLRPALVECNDLDDWVFLSTTELKRAVFSTSGWRLTRTGVELLSSVFQSYNTRNEENIQVTGKILLGMDRCCKSPWFLGGKMITVFNSHVHLEIQMVGGRMSDFIDFKMIKP